MNVIVEKFKNGTSKRFVENSVIFLILLVILIIVINSLYGKSEEEISTPVNTVQEKTKVDELELKLEKILSMIEGAGKVNVMISYLSSIEQIPLYDKSENITITEEMDKEGGTRKTKQSSNEESVVFEEKSSNRVPVIKQTIMPEIIGVIAVSEGASNIKVRENIINAIEATVNVPSHRIQVFSKQK